jgi:hypothetical protein
MQITNTIALTKFMACYQYQRTICLPWSTFHLMDSLIPNGRKIVNIDVVQVMIIHDCV